MNPLLTRLIELESEVAYRTAPEPGRLEFSIVKGHIPVLLSAPHGAAHYRNGQLKEEDEYTAGMARLVAEMTGAHAMVACRESNTDPNYYPGAPYKLALQNFVDQHPVNIVLDIHGCSPKRDFGIALGTMQNRSCPRHRSKIIQTLEAHGFSQSNHGLTRLDIDETFPANGSHRVETVTQFAYKKLKVPAAQIEINAHLRIAKRLPNSTSAVLIVGKPEDILHTIQVLIALVNLLKTG